VPLGTPINPDGLNLIFAPFALAFKAFIVGSAIGKRVAEGAKAAFALMFDNTMVSDVAGFKALAGTFFFGVILWAVVCLFTAAFFFACASDLAEMQNNIQLHKIIRFIIQHLQ
jgi:hypothetical protein